MNTFASGKSFGSNKLRIFAIATIVIGLLMSWLPVIGLVAAVVAVVVNLLAKKKGAFTKWIGVIVAVAVLLISAYLSYISIFEVSSESVNNAISNLKTADVIPADVLDDHKEIAQTKKFREAAKHEIEQFKTFSSLCHFMVNLEQVDCRNDELKESFDAAVNRFFPNRETWSEGKDIRSLVEYLQGVAQFEEGSFYYDDAMKITMPDVNKAFFSKMTEEDFIQYLKDVDSALHANGDAMSEELTEMLLPYDLIRDTFKNTGDALSTGETGYYADRADQYSDSSEWYDPLAEEKGHGEIGQYQTTIQYELYGDFMYREERVYWWETDPDDEINTSEESLTVFAQNEQWDILEGDGAFLMKYHLEGGEAYFISSGKSVTVAVFKDGEAVIATPNGNTMTISKE